MLHRIMCDADFQIVVIVKFCWTVAYSVKSLKRSKTIVVRNILGHSTKFYFWIGSYYYLYFYFSFHQISIQKGAILSCGCPVNH